MASHKKANLVGYFGFGRRQHVDRPEYPYQHIDLFARSEKYLGSGSNRFIPLPVDEPTPIPTPVPTVEPVKYENWEIWKALIFD